VDYWIIGLLPESAVALSYPLIHHSTNPLPHFCLPGRLISRTPPFEGGHVGANPTPAANFGKSSFDPLGSETESRLAYTQQSEGQHLPERPFAVEYGSLHTCL
jgi:hypothetical protein